MQQFDTIGKIASLSQRLNVVFCISNIAGGWKKERVMELQGLKPVNQNMHFIAFESK